VLPTDLSIDDDLYMAHGIQDNIRYLCADDIDELCIEDTRTLLDMDKARTAEGHMIMTVLPTTGLIDWQHKRVDFMAMKIHKKSPTVKGALHSSNAWIYWHHDFRKQRLFVQRIRISDEPGGERDDVLVSLVLCAIREAQSWPLPTVVLWGVASDLHNRFDILKTRLGRLNPILQTQRRETTSFRWRGGKNDKTDIIPDEHYAWN